MDNYNNKSELLIETITTVLNKYYKHFPKMKDGWIQIDKIEAVSFDSLMYKLAHVSGLNIKFRLIGFDKYSIDIYNTSHDKPFATFPLEYLNENELIIILNYLKSWIEDGHKAHVRWLNNDIKFHEDLLKMLDTCMGDLNNESN